MRQECPKKCKQLIYIDTNFTFEEKNKSTSKRCVCKTLCLVHEYETLNKFSNILTRCQVLKDRGGKEVALRACTQTYIRKGCS